MKSRKFIFTAVIVAFLLNACATPQPALTPTPVATPTPVPTATAIPTATLIPTSTPTPKPTTMPTGEPKGISERTQREQNYKVVDYATTVGPNGINYVVYLLTRPDPSTSQQQLPSFVSPTQNCSLLFYYWDGYDYQLIDLFQVTRGNCRAINWERPFASKSAEEKSVLKLDGYWSDINGNGLPEFSVIFQDACTWQVDYNCIDFTYFEIQSINRIVNLNTGVQGKIVSNNILYKSNPRSIYVYKYDEYASRAGTRVNLIYTWDGTRFVDTSLEYPEVFQKSINETANRIKENYGKPLEYEPWGFLNMLAIYNYSPLSQKEVLETFIEVTNPTHYPGTKPMQLCLLQVTRAQALIDFENKKTKFQINFIPLPKGPNTTGWGREKAAGIDPKKYDVNACYTESVNQNPLYPSATNTRQP